ncbi:MAG: 16S rRNA (cytidine(1402)-2'-O)-methyltransferase [Chloroflexi bacterium RBG_16_64_43]|nr:MAG: 16S rRNA (cytidine(1402)-2'-O)-methyltransferase [Chloroflexi bacterium RBG_16_64_43]
MGTLFLVATPIGNLEDISPRALRVLREVSLVAAEDTRQTRKLLSHFDLHTPLTAYHEHNKLTRLAAVLSALARADVALVSDAGTPGLNDPGYELVRAALGAGHMVTPVPGPSAPIAALVSSGLPTDRFFYMGYLERRAAARRGQLAGVAALQATLVALEAPHRLLAALGDVRDVLGNRQMAVARELTKLHEEILRGRVSEVLEHFERHAPRGEVTLVIAGAPPAVPTAWDESRVRKEVQARVAAGETATHAAAEVAHESGWTRRTVYRLATAEARPGPGKRTAKAQEGR